MFEEVWLVYNECTAENHRICESRVNNWWWMILVAIVLSPKNLISYELSVPVIWSDHWPRHYCLRVYIPSMGCALWVHGICTMGFCTEFLYGVSVIRTYSGAQTMCSNTGSRSIIWMWFSSSRQFIAMIMCTNGKSPRAVGGCHRWTIAEYLFGR